MRTREEMLELYSLFEAITECEDGEEMDRLFDRVDTVREYSLVDDDLEVLGCQWALFTESGDEAITVDYDMRAVLYENEDFRELREADRESLLFFLEAMDRWHERRRG